jgi:hypothetical protein
LTIVLVASVITTEFVTLTVTVFVKEALKLERGRLLFSLSEKYFRPGQLSQIEFQNLPRLEGTRASRALKQARSLRSIRVLC